MNVVCTVRTFIATLIFGCHESLDPRTYRGSYPYVDGTEPQ